MHGYYSETDREVGKTLLEYWTNFVKTGKPTTELWTKFDSQSMQRLQIDSEGEVSLESLYGNTMVKSWLELYKENPPKLKQSQTILNSKFSQIFLSEGAFTYTANVYRETTNKLMFGAGASVAFKIWCRN